MNPPMSLSPQGLDFIKAREGFSASVYTDTAGQRTIGYGHRLAPGESFPGPIEESEATLLLARDAETAVAAVNRLVTVDLTQARFDALVSFAYNLGAAHLAALTLLRLLNAGDVAGAAARFPDWDKEHEGGRLVVDQGLLNRRLAEQRLFTSGAYA